MNRLIACCGFDCEKCEVRIATIAGSDALRKEVARKWSVMDNAPRMTADMIYCHGCRTEGTKFGYCSMCEIRSCALGKGFETCGQCAESDTCLTAGAIVRNIPG